MTTVILFHWNMAPAWLSWPKATIWGLLHLLYKPHWILWQGEWQQQSMLHCDLDGTVPAQFFSADVEYLFIKHQPFYQVREFTSAISSACVYFLKRVVNSLEAVNPDAISSSQVISWRNALLNYQQHVSCSTWCINILDHWYTIVKYLYCTILPPHFNFFSTKSVYRISYQRR